ncbi:MAG: hypothetical protein LBU46_04150, partial [Candidatus Accumulibacter sp.]|nr:hypothetical protein [Accumulibacter sp.]
MFPMFRGKEETGGLRFLALTPSPDKGRAGEGFASVEEPKAVIAVPKDLCASSFVVKRPIMA